MNFRRLLLVVCLGGWVLLVVLTLPAHCQIRAGCTASSMASQQASSLSALEIGRWECDVQNLNPTETFILTRSGFALDFPELRQIDPSQVDEIFVVKQKKTGKARAAEYLSYILLGAGFAISGGVPLTRGASTAARIAATKRAANIGIGSTVAHLYVDKLTSEIPGTKPAIGTQLIQDVPLPPGGTYHWTTFASKMRNADHVGPKILTMPGTEPGIPIPPKPPNAKANPIPWIRQQMLCG